MKVAYLLLFFISIKSYASEDYTKCHLRALSNTEDCLEVFQNELNTNSTLSEKTEIYRNYKNGSVDDRRRALNVLPTPYLLFRHANDSFDSLIKYGDMTGTCEAAEGLPGGVMIYDMMHRYRISTELKSNVDPLSSEQLKTALYRGSCLLEQSKYFESHENACRSLKDILTLCNKSLFAKPTCNKEWGRPLTRKALNPLNDGKN